ncbi:hypothetical protein WJX72_011632 [[Myrmecia] bisecta]|uniref:Metallo-beta-lactamase domain-containing protein n=1 Tax=[Myrmecia] bisecta TaxID=41462 RepID=A0AAW1R9Y9_9CHLO
MALRQLALLPALALLSVLLYAGLSHADPQYVLGGDVVPANTARIIALGTGTPNVYKDQLATSYLIQLGLDGQNVTNILFDVGTGSIVNLYATQVSLANVATVFLSHLHSDHITDLAPLYALASGRSGPLQVWGPSGASPDLGTNATVAGLKAFLGWDQASRNHVSEFPAGYTGNQIVAHEFNYSVPNQLVYNQSGVVVYSNPAFHYDTPGPVSLKLQWRNLTITYSGDTVPLTTFVDFALGSDVVIHEAVGPVYNLSAAAIASKNIALNHTTAVQVGQIFQAIQPRLAIATHLSLRQDTYVPLVSAIRSSFPAGPLALAQDLAVWDVSATSIQQRRFLVIPNGVGGLFTAPSAAPNPAGYKFVTQFDYNWPFPATTHTGLQLYTPGQALAPLPANPASVAASSTSGRH